MRNHRLAVVGTAFLMALIAAWLLSPGDLWASSDKASKTPKKATSSLAITVDANTRFAADLYRHLSKEHPDENLFFSPYSISSGLLIVAEGARGETADQMGRVLRFPEALRSNSQDAASIPWKTTPLHYGEWSLRRSLIERDMTPEAQAARKRIAELRARLEEVQKPYKDFFNGQNLPEGDADEVVEIELPVTLEREIIAELDSERAKVDQYELSIASSLWLQKGFPFRQEYVRTIRKYHGAERIYYADFKNSIEKVRSQINDQVERETEGLIRNAISPEDMDHWTRFVMTNVIYFRGEWPIPFNENLTEDADFTLFDDQEIQVPMMTATRKGYRYAAFNVDGSPFDTPRRVPREVLREESEAGKPSVALYPDEGGFAMVELPYKGKRVSMVVIAPRSPSGLPSIEAKVTAENLKSWITHLEKRKVHLFLPRFKLETSYTLGDGRTRPEGILPEMGMPRAFSKGKLQPKAQFEGLFVPSAPGEFIYLDKVLHKASLEVNEKGTVATAATMAFGRFGSAAASNMVPFTPTFKADRPFLFLIRDTETGTILFLGRVMRP